MKSSIPKVYLDTSGFKRPFDDQSQPRIALETEAVVTILAMAQAGEIVLIGSPVLRYENSRNPSAERRQWTERALQICRQQQPLNAAVQSRARELERQGIKPLDALHVASAEAAQADHLITCDDRLVRKSPGTLCFLNPTQFVLTIAEEI